MPVALFPNLVDAVTLVNGCVAGVADVLLEGLETDEMGCAGEFGSSFAANAVVELAPFTHEELGGVRWEASSDSSNLLQRHVGGRTKLTRARVRGSERSVLERVTRGNEQDLEQIDTLQANGLNWTTYMFHRDSDTLKQFDTLNFVAIAAVKGETRVVILTLGEGVWVGSYYWAGYYGAVLLTSVEAYTPNAARKVTQ